MFGFFWPHFLSNSIYSCCWSQLLPFGKQQSKQSGCALVHLCTSACKCIHSRAHTSQSSGRDSPEDSQKITPCSHIIPSFRCLQDSPLLHRTRSQLTQLLFHHYVEQKCSSSPCFIFLFFFFGKPFHFSLLRGSCSVMGCSHSARLRLKRTQPDTRRPSVTPDGGSI